MCFLLSSCTDYVEVENLTIVTAVAVDTIENNEMGYKISLEVVKFPNDTTEVTIVEAQGETFPEAITNAIKITGNDLYFSHAQALIISDDIAYKSIYPFIDFAYRNTDFRLNTSILIAKDVTAYEILAVPSLIDDIAGVQIKKILDSNNFISEVPSVPIYKFIDNLTTAGICGFLPVVSIVESEHDTKVREISGLALFENDILYDFIDQKQTKTLNVLQNNAKTGKVINEYDVNTPTYNLKSSKTTITPTYQLGKLSFEFDVKMDIELIEQMTKINSYSVENQAKMQEEITNAVKKDINELINLQKTLSTTDFLGLGNLVYRKFPKVYNDISDFSYIIENLDYNLNVECKIIGTGLVSTPLSIEN